jgi:hypothetical protein
MLTEVRNIKAFCLINVIPANAKQSFFIVDGHSLTNFSIIIFAGWDRYLFGARFQWPWINFEIVACVFARADRFANNFCWIDFRIGVIIYAVHPVGASIAIDGNISDDGKVDNPFAFLAVLIAFITISFQAIKAALMNPAKSLKAE